MEVETFLESQRFGLNEKKNSRLAAVSTIIPVFDRPQLLKRSLDSVAKQTLLPCEIIIVDDGSSFKNFQATKEIVSTFCSRVKNICLIRLTTNQGVSAARNLGIHLASQPWIALLDSDDEWLPRKLELQFGYAITNPQVSLIHCNELWRRNGHHVNQKKIHIKEGGMVFERCLERCMIGPSASFFSRKYFLQLGGFNNSLQVCEDYDLWLRWTAHAKVDFLEEQLVIKHGGHTDQLSQKYHSMDYERVKSLFNLFMKSNLSSAQKTLVYQVALSKTKVLNLGYLKHGDPLNRKSQIELWLNLMASSSDTKPFKETGGVLI